MTNLPGDIDEASTDNARPLPLFRRELLRRTLFLAGGVASTGTLLNVLGCTTSGQATPAATSVAPAAPPPLATPSPPAAAKAASTSSAAGARSPLAVAADDPAVEAQEITFTSGGATIMAYQARPRQAAGPLPVVLVCHENRGLVEHIRDVTRRFAKHGGYLAVAVDLLSREGGTANVADASQIPSLLSGADPNRHVGDFQAAVDYYRMEGSLADTNRVGIIGFCFGGAVAWRAATRLRELQAAAPFYGSSPPLEDVSNIQAAVLGVYAEQDQRINQGIEPLRTALEQSGKTFAMKIYPGVGHAFHNDTGQNWNEVQALAAWQDTLAWFDVYLRA